MDKFLNIFVILLLTQTISCQKMKEIPTWKPSMCNPLYSNTDERFSVQIGPNEITTLEGIEAALPGLRSSGYWGDSGGSFSDLQGTPIAADVTYFSNHEDKFYRVKMDFGQQFMEKAVAEIHYSSESDMYNENQAELGGGLKGGFDKMIFGFAPEGMVVVWRGYGAYRIELGRYQAEVVADDKDLEKNMFPDDGMSRADVVAMYVMPEPVTSEKWDKYRKRFNIKFEIISENKGFKLFEVDTENFNGEYFYEFRPKILKQEYENRALFRKIHLSWETGMGEVYASDIFFSEKILYDVFQNIKPEQTNDLKIKIAADNSSLVVFLNNEPINTEASRIWQHKFSYRDSYE